MCGGVGVTPTMWISSDKFNHFATLPQRPLSAIGKVANLVCLSTQLYVDASLPGKDGLGSKCSQRASSYYLNRSQRRGMGTNLDTVWGISKIGSM